MNPTPRNVRMLDLGAEYALFKSEVRTTIDAVLESQQFINGPAVAELEQALAERVEAKQAVAVGSGTDALLCALMALDIGPGDDVIVPTFTFFATAGCVARIGARPVFVDVDPRTFNMDPRSFEAAITLRTRAVIPVHLYGQCAEMNEIQLIASKHGLAVIEDAAQSLGATFGGRRACSFGQAACISFYPTKNLGAFGEGGMVFTSDADVATALRQFRNHGESKRYYHDRIGGNFRFDTLKAAILLVKLKYLDGFTQKRRRNAARYNELMTNAPVTCPFVPAGHQPVYHQYTILCDQRDELAAYLNTRGVATAIYYPVPLHLQRCFAPLGLVNGSLPVAEDLCKRVLSLPCHPMLGDDDLQYVASCIQEFFALQNRDGIAQSSRGLKPAAR